MTPDEALATALKQSPRAAIILIENPNGSLGLLTGPDMTVEHINFVMDQAKNYLMGLTMGMKVPNTIPEQVGVLALEEIPAALVLGATARGAGPTGY